MRLYEVDGGFTDLLLRYYAGVAGEGILHLLVPAREGGVIVLKVFQVPMETTEPPDPPRAHKGQRAEARSKRSNNDMEHVCNKNDPLEFLLSGVSATTKFPFVSTTPQAVGIMKISSGASGVYSPVERRRNFQQST